MRPIWILPNWKKIGQLLAKAINCNSNSSGRIIHISHVAELLVCVYYYCY